MFVESRKLVCLLQYEHFFLFVEMVELSQHLVSRNFVAREVFATTPIDVGPGASRPAIK